MPELRQFTGLKQTLALAPQMQQSLKILQAGTHELREIANLQLNSNPLLEELKPEIDTISLDDPDSFSPAGGGSNEGRDIFFNSIPERESFHEHIRNQAMFDITDLEVYKAFMFLAGFLDERGFLAPEAEEKARREGFSADATDSAIAFMQNCDPAGIGARSVWESYMIQLNKRRRGNSLAYRILESCVHLLEKRKIPEISKAMMAEEADVEKAMEEIASLDPSPAKTFSTENAKEISADLVFKKLNGNWTVSLTNEYVPKLRINNTYRELIGRGGLSKQDTSYIAEKMRDGKFIIDAIEQRQATILKIGKSILEKQHDFFEKGREYLHPLTMTDIADGMGINPATVSRAVSGKYARIGYSLMPLKEFFAGGYNKHESGEAVASTSVKETIREIVENENSAKPLSDGKICEILSTKNITIARRTVAKYREELGIPAKGLRKRFS